MLDIESSRSRVWYKVREKAFFCFHCELALHYARVIHLI